MAFFAPADQEPRGGWVQHTNRSMYRPQGGDLVPPFATKHNNDVVPAGIGEPTPKPLHAQHGRVYHEHHKVRVFGFRALALDGRPSPARLFPSLFR